LAANAAERRERKRHRQGVDEPVLDSDAIAGVGQRAPDGSPPAGRRADDHADVAGAARRACRRSAARALSRSRRCAPPAIVVVVIVGVDADGAAGEDRFERGIELALVARRCCLAGDSRLRQQESDNQQRGNARRESVHTGRMNRSGATRSPGPRGLEHSI
jgi:hypothetical protein